MTKREPMKDVPNDKNVSLLAKLTFFIFFNICLHWFPYLRMRVTYFKKLNPNANPRKTLFSLFFAFTTPVFSLDSEVL